MPRPSTVVRPMVVSAAHSGPHNQGVPMKKNMFRRGTAGAVLAVAALGAGGALAAPGTASAATSAVTTAAASVVDQSQSQRTDEHLLTGTTAAKVKALAVAKYPTATVERVETDSDGGYEGDLLLADGSQLIVQVDASFAITGTQTMGGHAGAGAAASSSAISG